MEFEKVTGSMIFLQVFGDMAVSGMDKDMKNALNEGANNLESQTPSEPKVCVIPLIIEQKFPNSVLLLSIAS